jgi:hypothetical protein
MNDGKVPFQLKFLRSWLIIGFATMAIMAVVLFFSGQVGGQGVPADLLIKYLLVSPLSGLFFGGVGFVFDAVGNWRWKFWNVRNYPWVWHFYPIGGAFILALFPLAFVWAVVSSRR